MNSSPKKLSINEMWELHKLLGLKSNSDYLIDEIVSILENTPHKNIQAALGLMYDTVSFSNPLQYGLLIIRGLKTNHFFDFQNLMSKLNVNVR